MSNDLVNGSDGNDVIDAGDGNDTVNAGGGDDVIYQKDAGSDVVDGGEGNDRLVLDFSGDVRGLREYAYGATGNLLGSINWDGVVPDGTVKIRIGGDYSPYGVSNAFAVTYTGIEHLEVTGTRYQDWLVGGALADVLRGGGDSDYLVGGDGDDLLEGGAGHDYLDGGNGDDVLNGGAGDDTFQVHDGRSLDQVDGGDGTDTLMADLSWWSGDVVLDNDPAVAATLPGGTVFTSIEGFNLTLGAGNDVLRNTRTWSNDRMNAGDGNDVIDAGGGNDTVIAGAGDDVIYQKDAGSDVVDGGEGNDRLVLDFSGDVRGLREYAYGATGNLLGSINWDGVVPDGTVKIRIGGDYSPYGVSNAFAVTYTGIEHLEVTGTRYQDWLVGGALADVLRGGGDSDYLVGGDGDDLLEGGAGHDYLDGGNGDDVLNGGAGDDTFQVHDGRSLDQVDGGDGTDTLMADLSWWSGDVVLDNDPAVAATLPGGTVFTSIEGFNLTLGAGNDVLRNTRTWSNDRMNAGDGNDVIDAGGGNDTVIAGAGDDVIYQKDAGSDVVDGGEGNDRLVLDFSGDVRGLREYAYGATGNLLGSINWDGVVPDGTVKIRIGGDYSPYGVSNAFAVTYTGIEHLEVTGTRYQDWLVGGALADVLRGGGDSDYLVGGDGDDLLEGGAGHDYLDGGNGDDVLNGGADDDTFQVHDGRSLDQVDGGDGTDTLMADLSWWSGDVVLDNDPAVAATLPGGTVFTSIEGFNLTLGAGNDVLRNTRTWSNDRMNAGDGNDVIDAGGGNDTVIAGAGDDVIYQKDAGSDVVDGGEGNDRLVLDFSGDVRGLREYAYGATGNLLGSINWDGVVPDGTVKIRIGGDYSPYGVSNAFAVTYTGIEHLEVTGTRYQDWLVGGALADVLRGGGDSDYLVGGDGDDLLEGGAGHDYLDGGNGDDVLNGGAGDDTFQVHDGRSLDQVDGGDGTDTLMADLSWWSGDVVLDNDPAVAATLPGGTVFTSIEGFNLTLGAGNDVLRNTRTWSNDRMNAGDGNDVIDAGGGNDTVIAGAGDDVIYQKDAGSDVVDGGEGNDRLVLDFSGDVRGLREYAYGATGNLLGSINWDGVVPDGTVKIRIGGDYSPYGVSNAFAVTYTGIEHLEVTGTRYQDWLVGGALADVLRGGGDSDYLVGGDGDDLLEGGAGHDYLDGGNGDDVLNGGADDDTFQVHDGDRLDGDDGSDTVNCAGAPAAALVDMSLGLVINNGYGYQNILASVENVVGSNYNDVFRGGPGSNAFDGGAGFDTVDYSAATGAVVVDLRPGTAFQDGMGGQDTLSRIELIIGSANNDVLSGDANSNVFEGGAGNDNLIGNGGDDTLNPGTGIDQVDGGDGTDRLVLDWSSIGVASAADGIVTDLFDAHGSLVDDPSKAVEWVFHTALSTDNIVSVRNVEQFDIAGTSADDTLIGGVFTGTLAGGFGNDFLAPGLGVNTLIGGPGNDVFVGSGAMFNGDSIQDFAVGDRIKFTDVSLAAASIDYAAGILTISPGGVSAPIAINVGDTIKDISWFLVDKLQDELTIDVPCSDPPLSTISIIPLIGPRPTEGNAGETSGADFTIVRSGNLTGDVTVFWAVGPGPANSATPDDFTTDPEFPHGSVRFDDEPCKYGTRTQQVSFEVHGDNQQELDELYVVNILPVGALLGIPSTGQGIIINDDDVPTITIDPPTIKHKEGDAGVVTLFDFLVTRTASGSGNLLHETKVNYDVSRGSLGDSAEPEDLVRHGWYSSEVVFHSTTDLQQSEHIVVEVLGDDDALSDDPLESFDVFLTGVGSPGSGVIKTSLAFGVIEDDDRPVFRIDPIDTSKDEGTGVNTDFRFVISRNGDPNVAADVNYTLLTSTGTPGYANSADFAGPTFGFVHFDAGAPQAPIAITVSGDSDPEHDELFEVMLISSSVGEIDPDHAIAASQIIDDDNTSIGIHSVNAHKQEGTDIPGGKPFTFEVTRSGNLSQELTTTYFVRGTGANPADGNDFEGGGLPFGPIHFAANDSTPQIITLHVAADRDAEKDEGFEVVLGPTTASVNPGRASGTIVDDDTSTFSIVPSRSRTEGNSGTTHFKFAVTRSGNTDVAQTISYSVSGDPSDVSGPFGGSITFAPSETKQDIDIGVIGDTVVEPSEKFTVTLTDPHVAGIEFNNKQSIGTIVNDDPDLPRWPRPVFRGDPHLVSFDGLAYDFQAAGEFVLAQGAEGSGIEVQARTAPIGDLASNMTAIATLIDGHRVTIDTFADQPMRIDGVVTVVPADTGFIDVGNGTIAFDGSTYSLIDPGRVSLIVQDLGNRLDLVMSADHSLAGTLTGLLGNFNGDTADDLTLVDGTVLSQPIRFADLYGSFANSWRVTQENSLFDYGAGATTDTYTDRDFPRMALTLDMLPAELVSRATDLVDQAGITDPTVRAAAILDLAVTGDLSFLASAAIPVEPRATVEVVDTPAPLAVLSVASAATTQVEGDDGTREFDFDLFRTGNTAGSLEVFYEVVPIGDHPASAEDFSGGEFPKGSLTIFDGQERAKIVIAVAGDTAAEHSETFAVQITVAEAEKSSVLIAVPAAPVTIENDDGDLPASLDINPVTASATEGDTGLTTLTFAVIRSGDMTTETTVDYSVQGTGNHPAQGEDFDGGSYPTGRLNFLADETRKVITISVASDTTVESDEGFVVTLANPSNAVLGVATATGRILNDDMLPPPTVAIAATDAYKEEGNSGTTAFTFVVSRTGDTGAETSVDYLVAGSGSDPATATDFGGAFPAGSVLFATGEQEKLITIEVSGDTIVEPNEDFTVTLTNASNGTLTIASAVGTIENDDLLPPPTLRMAAVHAQQAEGDAGSTAFTFAISRSGDLSTDTRVQYSVNGTATADDFAGGILPSGTLVFAPGSAEQLLTINVAGDHQIEPHEAFVVSLHDPVNGNVATGTADGVIFNDDTSSFKIGDAPARPPRSDAGAWERSWTHDGVRISHKADLNDPTEAFTDVLFGSSGSGVLVGGDISAGDLGVSGQTKPTSSVLQEIDGTEGLRFVLDEEANQITFQLSRFQPNDDGTGLKEAGRLQLLDADGSLVKELFFYADRTDGTRQVSLSVAEGFTQAILSAGAHSGDDFVYGGYGNADGSGFGASPFAASGSLHGSDYLLDSVQFASGYVDMFWV